MRRIVTFTKTREIVSNKVLIKNKKKVTKYKNLKKKIKNLKKDYN